jgi:hypothetical protein
MGGVSVCTCGAGPVCDRKCAGALAQQQECAENGHLTASGIHQAVWRVPINPVLPGLYCFRCGATVDAS